MADQAVIDAEAVPAHLGRHPLVTVNQVAEEAARVYRAFMRGRLTKEQANAATYQLQVIGKLIEVADIEKRLDALENQT